jgi:hypothetical protein
VAPPPEADPEGRVGVNLRKLLTLDRIMRRLPIREVELLATKGICRYVHKAAVREVDRRCRDLLLDQHADLTRKDGT